MKDPIAQNAQYIQQLNKNIEVLDVNVQVLLSSLKESMANMMALQKTVLQVLQKHDLLDLEEFRKAYLKNIAEGDQESAKRRDELGGVFDNFLL